MRLQSALILSALLAASASAQVFEEKFNFPDGPIVPGWTQQLKTWAVKNGRLVATGGSAYSHITKDGFTLKDSVLEGEFFHMASGTQFGGLISRHPGGSTNTGFVLAKLQDNSSTVPDFDSCWLYEQGVGATAKTGLTSFLSGYCRLITLDNVATMLVDTDKNGSWDLTVGPRTLTTALGPGLVGMTGFAVSEMDNFKLFDAVLVATSGAVPKIGGAYKMQLRGEPPVGPPIPYFCLASLSNSGIPIGARKLPLGIDVILSISLSAPAIFSNFAGLLDANGDGFPVFNIPNDPILVGLKLYFAGFTIDPQKQFGIGNISNDHMAVIEA